MKNVILTPLEAEDLRVQAEKVLRGLGNPEPPIDLQSVYELLRLDRQFYSSTDDGAVREFVSRVKVAGRQIVARPTLLIDVIRKAQLSAENDTQDHQECSQALQNQETHGRKLDTLSAQQVSRKVCQVLFGNVEQVG